MYKRFFLILSVLLMIFATSQAEENSIRIELSIHQEEKECSTSFDAFFSDEKISIISDFFPSYCLFIPISSGYEDPFMYKSAEQGLLSRLNVPDMVSFLYHWIMNLPHEESNGIYAGDAFDEAGSMVSAECSFSELLILFHSVLDLPDELFSLFRESISLYMNNITEAAFRFSIYDKAKFISLTGILAGKVFFTLSADFSDELNPHIVIGYAESGKNYYIDARIRSISDTETELTASLFSDMHKNGYRGIVFSNPVIHEEWQFIISDDHEETAFECRVIPESTDLSTILIKGTVSHRSSKIIRAEIRIKDHDESYYSFSVQRSDKKKDLLHLKEIELKDNIYTIEPDLKKELFSTASQFLSDLLTSLPVQYAERIIMIQ